MNINISKILTSSGASMVIEQKLDEVLFKNFSEVESFVKPVNIKGNLENLDGVLSLDANLTTAVLIECGRCLTPVSHELDFEFSQKFSKIFSLDGEFEGIFEDSIDLVPVASKFILENLPMKILCNDDCKGLCQKCGNNFNEGDCSCEKTELNPQFAALLGMFESEE